MRSLISSLLLPGRGGIHFSLRNVAQLVSGFKPPVLPSELSRLSDPSFVEKTRENLKARRSSVNLDELLHLHCRYCSGDVSVEPELLNLFSQLPNSTHPASPVGDESQIREVQLHGTKREAPYTLKTAVDLTSSKRTTTEDDPFTFHPGGHLRIKTVANSTGQRTYYFSGPLARLESALVDFTLDRLTKSGGFQLVSVPDVLPESVIHLCGFPTRGKRSQVYKLNLCDEPVSYCLSGTSEMALAGFCAGKVFGTTGEPSVGLCAVSRCFRQEAPHQEAPLYRVHQFTKVEMFAVTPPDSSAAESMFEKIVRLQTSMFAELGLHFRVLDMPTAELGDSAHRKFDIEAWMPGENRYGEISSTSNCLDYQAKRLAIRWASPSSGEENAYTLNGTGCAVPRMMMALLETHQTKDGAVRIPEVLRPYLPNSDHQERDCDISFKYLNA